MCIGLILRISIGNHLWVKLDTKYFDYFIDICAFVLFAYHDWNHLWVKLDTKYFDYFIDMICALVLSCVSRLELFMGKIRHKIS